MCNIIGESSVFCVLTDGQQVTLISMRASISLVFIIRVCLFNLTLIFKKSTLFFFNSPQTVLEVARYEGTHSAEGGDLGVQWARADVRV